MSIRAVNDREFLEEISKRISQQREILALIEYSRAAGSKSFEFMQSFAMLTARLEQLTPDTRVTVFTGSHLPLRGCVDDHFIEECLRQIAEGSEFLVVETAPRNACKVSWFHHRAGISHKELRDALEDSRGRTVAAGIYPQPLSDGVSSITAYMPDPSGNIRIGVY